MILILYPPGWVTLYPAQPLGIATLASILRDEDIPCRQVDLEILAHEFNRAHPESSIPLDAMVAPAPFSGLLKRPEMSGRLHEAYESTVVSLLSLFDYRDVKLVAFSILGERQFVAAAILASWFRAQGIPVLAGGCFITRNAAWIAARGLFDALFTGLDATAFLSACRGALGTNGKPESHGDSAIYNGNCRLDALPQPVLCRSLSDRYRRAVKEIYRTGQGHLIVQYLLDTGCTHRCSFCTRFHGRYEKRSLGKIVAGIRALAEEQNTPLFSMTTNGVNFEEDRAVRIFNALAETAPGLQWHAYAVPTLTDQEQVRLLARAGCRILRFGLESASPKMLRLLNKRITPSQAARCFELAHEAGIWVQVSFMVGCPQEDSRDIDENCRFLEKCHRNIDSVRINPFFLQHDSDISRRPESFGIRLRSSSGLRLGFDEIGGLDWPAKVRATLAGIERMYATMRNLGIGFHGISCHLLLCALYENGSREAATRWMDRVHPFHRENLSPELIQWKIYHAHEPGKCPYGSSWESNYGLIYEKGLQ